MDKSSPSLSTRTRARLTSSKRLPISLSQTVNAVTRSHMLGGLKGMENIVFNAAVIGLKRKEFAVVQHAKLSKNLQFDAWRTQ